MYLYSSQPGFFLWQYGNETNETSRLAHPWQTRTNSETISAIGWQVQLEVGVRIDHDLCYCWND